MATTTRKYRDGQIAAYRKDGWVTPMAVAKALHFAPSSIYRLADVDTVVSKKVGAAVYLKIESLEKHFGVQTIRDAKL